jgi:transcriptional regulator with XRE-family HTH domain
MEVDVKTLTELRTQRGFSRRQLALSAGLSPGAVSIAERRGSASLETLKKLGDVLGVGPDELAMRPPERSGREAFFESQRHLAVQALESIRGAEQAVGENHLDYARRFLKLAKDAVRSLEQAQRDALKTERGTKADALERGDPAELVEDSGESESSRVE